MRTWQASDYGGGWKILFGARNAAFLAMICILSINISSAYQLCI